MTRKQPLTDPRFSLVVTAYNYGHFLPAALNSLQGQTRPPHEIVVVDDGSTDNTPEILASYGARIKVVKMANGGQAAAFNLGFSKTSGDVVLFVDADDCLRPTAIEVLTHHWCEGLAALTFGLETIDTFGRSTGVYGPSIDADDGDNRPTLLRTGTFRFPPTTGTLYARATLEALLPMPQTRWRTSADCYLIRGAALLGRFAAVREVLGSYRLHHTNNYALGIAAHADLAQQTANEADNAAALEHLAARASVLAQTPQEAEGLRTALLTRAQRMKEGVGRGAANPWWQRRVPAHPAPPPPAIRGRADAVPAGGAALRLMEPRTPLYVPSGRWVELTTPPYAGRIVVPADPAASTQRLVFAIDPAFTTRFVTLALRGADAAAGARWLIRTDGIDAWTGVLDEPCDITLPLRPLHLAAARSVTIELLPAAQETAPRSMPVIEALRVDDGSASSAAPYLDSADPLPPARLLEAGLDGLSWRSEPNGALTLLKSTGALRFTAPKTARDLVVDLGSRPPIGWLTVRDNGQTQLSAALGSARLLTLRLAAPDEGGVHEITIAFEPDVTATAHPLRLEGVAVRADPSPSAPPPLNFGERVSFMPLTPSADALGTGWTVTDEDVVQNCAAEAVVTFALSQWGEGVALELGVEPLLAAPPGGQHLVAVSVHGDVAAVAALDGAATLNVPLPNPPPALTLRLGIHSVFVDPGAGQPLSGTEFAPLTLNWLALGGTASVARASSQADADRGTGHDPRPSCGLPWLVAMAKDHAVAQQRPLKDQTAGDHEDAWTKAATLLIGCDDKALVHVAADRRHLNLLIALGDASRGRPTTAEQSALHAKVAEAIARAATENVEVNGNENENGYARLRASLLAFLHCPAFQFPRVASFKDLPGPLLWAPDALADYLARPPNLESAEDHSLYRAYLGRLLASIDAALAGAPCGSALFRLAEATLSRLRTTQTIFATGTVKSLVRLRSRCIERLLMRRGKSLAKAYPPRRRSGPLRLGVLVRDVLANPEGWALLGMYEALDQTRFTPVLITLDEGPASLQTGDLFAETLCLAALDIDQAVRAIRALDLDLFVLGAYVGDWEKASAIVAHRLAPVGVWSAAVCPTTGGFLSFDVALTCRASEPETPERHYTESLAFIEGPHQAAYRFAPPPFTNRDRVRADLGVEARATVLASGAMAHKVTRELLAAWAKILKNAPGAVLVLYPFAPNWSMAFEAERFRRRIDAALLNEGVAPTRVILLATQTPERVRDIVSTADIYLDSFPYTGATTVC